VELSVITIETNAGAATVSVVEPVIIPAGWLKLAEIVEEPWV
jgi:hypothetical protein